jgi:uncharacterized damage-inducible protein DinB
MKTKILWMYKYNHWANTNILDALRNISPSELGMDLGGSFPTIRGTLLHILWVELMFLRRWRGLSTQDLSHSPELDSIQDIRNAWEGLEEERNAYLQELQESALDKPLNYSDSRGRPVSIALWQAIFQCINHSTFHRGQIVAKLRQLGKVPPVTDFMLFCREMRK